MNPELLRRTGEAIFGLQWQSPLARALGVNDRTVRRWATGEWPISPRLYDELLAVCAKRSAALSEIAAILKANRPR